MSLIIEYRRKPDKLWQAQVVGHPGLIAPGRSLAAAKQNIESAAHQELDLAEAAEVTESFCLEPAYLNDEVALAYRLLEEAEQAAKRANGQAAVAAAALVEAGFSLRDVGVILRCSHSKVQDLLAVAD